jgi:hypothetical protein
MYMLSDGKTTSTFISTDKSWRTKGFLDLVHSDLYGPMKTPTMFEAKCFLLLVDEFSKKIWVYFLNKKLDFFSKFVALKYLVEKQIGN